MWIAYIVLLLVSISCSLVGTLLVQKKSVMIADTLSHTLLLGIVLVYFLVHDLASPLLIVGAICFAIVTVMFIEQLKKRTSLDTDAILTIVQAGFFSIAVLLISIKLQNVHLDLDIVFLGEVLFASLYRTTLFNISIPIGILHGSIMLVCITTFILVFYPLLKVWLFDSLYALTRGWKVNFLNGALWILVAIVCVLSFQQVGMMLVITLMVAPALASQCIAHSFKGLLFGSAIFSVIFATIGYFVAFKMNFTVSGTVAVVQFIGFLIIFLARKIASSIFN